MSSGRGAESSMSNELIISDSAAVDPNCYYCQDDAHRNEEHKDVPDPKCADCQANAHGNNEHDEAPDLDCEECQFIAHNNGDHEEAPNPNCLDCQGNAHYSSLRSSGETPHPNCWICAKNAHENGEHGMNTTASRKTASVYPNCSICQANAHINGKHDETSDPNCWDCQLNAHINGKHYEAPDPNCAYCQLNDHINGEHDETPDPKCVECQLRSEYNGEHEKTPDPNCWYCQNEAHYNGKHDMNTTASRKTAAFSNSEYNLPPVAESESFNFFGTPTTKIRYARQRPDEDGFYVRQEVTPFDELGLVTHCQHPDDGTGNHGSYRCGEDPAHDVRTIIVDPHGPRSNYDMSYDQIGTQADSVTCEKHLNHTLKHEHQKATDAYRDEQESE